MPPQPLAPPSQIAVGIVFGSPLAGILDNVWEQTFLSLGYIGLLVIVFEGEPRNRSLPCVLVTGRPSRPSRLADGYGLLPLLFINS